MTRLTRRMVLVLGVLLLGTLVLQVKAQPPAKARRHRPAARVRITRAQAPAKTARAKADPYHAIRQRNLFRPLVVPESKAAAPGGSPVINWEELEGRQLPPAMPQGHGGREQVPAPSDDWVYSGFANVDGVMVAILQRPTSKEAMFVRQGDTTPEGQVAEITPQTLTLVRPSGDRTSLAICTDFIATPLNAVEQQPGGQDRGRPAGQGDRRDRMAGFIRGIAERLGFTSGGGSPGERWRGRRGRAEQQNTPASAGPVVNHLEAVTVEGNPAGVTDVEQPDGHQE